jgi:hypothetical protein
MTKRQRALDAQTKKDGESEAILGPIIRAVRRAGVPESKIGAVMIEVTKAYSVAFPEQAEDEVATEGRQEASKITRDALAYALDALAYAYDSNSKKVTLDREIFRQIWVEAVTLGGRRPTGQVGKGRPRSTAAWASLLRKYNEWARNTRKPEILKERPGENPENAYYEALKEACERLEKETGYKRKPGYLRKK